MKDINGIPCDEYTGPTFSINSYDGDGDVFERGIYIHHGEYSRVKVATTLRGFKAYIKVLQGMVTEIEENYNLPL